MAKFIELLDAGDVECDLIIGDSDMPASFVWYHDTCRFTEYGKNLYRKILESECVVLENGNIEILCEDYKLGEGFVLAAAGCISVSEYNKIFEEDDI